jgi:hypothetical protein
MSLHSMTFKAIRASSLRSVQVTKKACEEKVKILLRKHKLI